MGRQIRWCWLPQGGRSCGVSCHALADYVVLAATLWQILGCELP